MNARDTQKTDQQEILVVDDTLASLQLLTGILTNQGYRVRPASSGRLALRSVDVEVPDLILLDVKMPEMDGYEVCRRLKAEERSRQIPVIFISAFGETAEKVKGFKAGGVDYITKPFEPEEVLARIRTHLRIKNLTRELQEANKELEMHRDKLEKLVEERTAALSRANAQLTQEISERKKAEERLIKSEERYSLAQKVANIGSWDWNIQTDDLYWSEQIEPMFGFARGEFGATYQDFLDCVHPDDRQCVLDSVNACVEKGKDYDIEHRIQWPDGSIHWVSATGNVFRDNKGKAARMLGIVQDITERQEALELVEERTVELQIINKKLEETHRELASFSYSVSHDLRAPLRAIDGFSHMLLEDYANEIDPDGKRKLKRISSSTQQMGQLVDGLLAFIRLGQREMKISHIDMQEMAEEVFHKLTSTTPKRQLRFIVKELPGTGGDRTMIRQVFAHLLSNAIKFTAPKKTAVIEVGSRLEKNEHMYYVKDNGVGFDMKYVDKLFGVFQRLHGADEFEGTGVGLALVQRIIHRHGGRVWAEGEVNKGAAFYFALPGKGEENDGHPTN